MPELDTAAVDKAVGLIRSHWHVGMGVILTRAEDPAAVPEYGEATIDGICRRIVSGLLNEGWTPPERAEPEADHGEAQT